MIETRWYKVILDLWSNKARTLLVVLAIAVGVFAVGLIASGQSLLLRELNRDYVASNAAAGTLYTTPFHDEMVASLRDVPGVGVVEGRRTVNLRVNVGPQEWRNLTLTVIPDFDDIRLDKINSVSGDWAPDKQELLLERLSLEYVAAEVGDTILVELDDGTQRELSIIGLAHDSNVPNAEVAERAFGFISLDTVEWLGLGRAYTELRFTVAEETADLDQIQTVATRLEDKLEKSGREVFWVNIPEPGEHWAEDIVRTLVLLFGVFGVLILFLSGFLVVNTISALLAQHIKQIGVMKLVGARRPQIMIMYFLMVLAFGGLSLAIGMPLAIFTAQMLVRNFVATLLNFNVTSLAVPTHVVAIQAAVALMVPMAAAAWPVVSGVQVTTHKALNSVGVGGGSFGRGLIDRLFVQLQERLPVRRPLIISLRNTIRRKGRLLLTLITLILGAALFISVLSVRSSVEATLDSFLRYHQYDVNVNFTRLYRQSQIERAAQQLPGVTAVESWLSSSARRIRPDGSDSDGISILAAPPATTFMDPPVENGRWLHSDDQNAIVVNTDFLDAEPDVGLGDTITLDIDGRELPWKIVGVARGAANGPTLYVSYDYYTYATRQVGEVNSLRVITEKHDASSQETIAAALAAHLQDDGYRVSFTRTTEAIREQLTFTFNIVLAFLVLMAVLLALVGGLGLTTTMSINVLERTREIGVLRAIGASDNAVRQIVLVEGVLIGLLSWGVGSLLAIPLSQVLSRQVGVALLGSPLNFSFSFSGMLLWLALVSVLAVAASLGPAHNASRLTIREVLAYE